MYFAKLGKEKPICVASQELAFAPKGCIRLPFMSRKSFLCDAVAGKVKVGKSCGEGTNRGQCVPWARKGRQQRAHWALRIGGAKGKTSLLLESLSLKGVET